MLDGTCERKITKKPGKKIDDLKTHFLNDICLNILIFVSFLFFSECNCHHKAEECYFNQTVADLSLSLDTHGQRRGGGVCIGCRDNTAGINCQTCVPGYYRPAEVNCPVLYIQGQFQQ